MLPESRPPVATVLIVEDNEPSRDALARRLERRGYTVLLAVDGQQGVSLARSERPDIILMDLGLPGIDGWEATKRLKNSSDTRQIPVIVLSAHAMTNDREIALAAGADEFDTKPVQFQQLIEKVESLLARATRP
jgi:two-component system, cell cycle response regulator DivK